MKTVVPIELSDQSLEKARKELQKFKESYSLAIKNIIRNATEKAYDKVIDYCIQGNLGEYTSKIFCEYDYENNVGRIWSDDLVIILNEFGTGIVGTQDAYADAHNYTVNMSGKGESGWAFPTKDGGFKWTHGIKSKHMFYQAFNDICAEFGYIINIELLGTMGLLYEPKE